MDIEDFKKTEIIPPAQPWPAILYRYTTVPIDPVLKISKAEQILQQNLLFCPTAVDFNDPFEVRMPLGEIDEKALFASAVASLQRREKMDFTTAVTNARKYFDSLGGESGVRERQERLYREMRKSSGIGCFSETCESIRMWSYYADKHKGICFGFDAQTLITYGAERVTYSVERPCLKFDVSLDWAVGFILSKSMEWEYEKEWRIVANKKGLWRFPFQILREVILGAEMSQSDRVTIRRIVQEKPQILVKEIVLSPKDYRLHVQPVDWSVKI